MTRPIPSLQTLEVFMAAARIGSFRAAAATIFLSPSAVSRHIAALESHLGTILFERTAAASRLTEAGGRYLAAIEPAMATIRDRTKRFGARSEPHDLTLAVSCPLMANWLFARLLDLRIRHQVGIRLIVSPDMKAMSNGNADAAIWSELGTVPPMPAEPLFDVEGIPAAAPRLLADQQALAKAPLLGARGSGDLWCRWLRPAEQALLKSRTTTFDTNQIAYEAAAAGLGIAIVVPLLAADDLKSGRLVTCGEARPLGDRYVFCDHSAETHRRRHLQLLRDWLDFEVKRTLGHFDQRCAVGNRHPLTERVAA